MWSVVSTIMASLAGQVDNMDSNLHRTSQCVLSMSNTFQLYRMLLYVHLNASQQHSITEFSSSRNTPPSSVSASMKEEVSEENIDVVAADMAENVNIVSSYNFFGLPFTPPLPTVIHYTYLFLIVFKVPYHYFEFFFFLFSFLFYTVLPLGF